MADRKKDLTRRRFLEGTVAAMATVTIVPRHVLGGPGQVPPSEKLGGALIGVGGRGPGTFGQMNGWGMNVEKLAECDVKWVGNADNKTRYTDFRRLLERKDIDVVAIATPPHWHALISIAAMEAGKDVLCEKPMTRFIAEGRAVAEGASSASCPASLHVRMPSGSTIKSTGRPGRTRPSARWRVLWLIRSCGEDTAAALQPVPLDA